jgi:hypothetical protein
MCVICSFCKERDVILTFSVLSHRPCAVLDCSQVPTELVTVPTAIMRQYLAQKNAQERDHSQGSEDPFLRSFGAGSGMSYSSAISHTPPRFTPASYEISHMKRARAGSISGRLRRYEDVHFVLQVSYFTFSATAAGVYMRGIHVCS